MKRPICVIVIVFSDFTMDSKETPKQSPKEIEMKEVTVQETQEAKKNVSPVVCHLSVMNEG